MTYHQTQNQINCSLSFFSDHGLHCFIDFSDNCFNHLNEIKSRGLLIGFVILIKVLIGLIMGLAKASQNIIKSINADFLKLSYEILF